MDNIICFEDDEYKKNKRKCLNLKILTVEDFEKAQEKILNNINNNKINSEEIIKVNNDIIYSLRYFYKKDENKLEFINIIKYTKNRSSLSVNLLLLFFGSLIYQIIVSEAFFLFYIGVFIFSLILFWLMRKKMIIVLEYYTPIVDKWINKIKISLDPSDLNIYNKRFNFVIALSSLIINSLAVFGKYRIFFESIESILTYISLFFILLSLIFLVISFFMWMGFNYITFILLLFLLLISSLLDSSTWTGISTLQSIILIIFTDEIWRLVYSSNFKKSYESLSLKRKEEINNRKFKFKVNIIGLTIIFYYAIIFFEKLSISQKLQENLNLTNHFFVFLFEKAVFILFLEIILAVVILIIRTQFIQSMWKDIVNSSINKVYGDFPIVKNHYHLNLSELKSFKPTVLIENIDDLSDEYSFAMKYPLKEGQNILIINYRNEISLIEVKLYIK